MAILLLLAGCGATTTYISGLPPVETVRRVDVDRYMGTWYEIASFPKRFQRGCHDTTATYSRRDDGDVDVVNRCRLSSGEERVASGLARIADPESNAKLRVTFFWPFWGDYWIIELGKEFEFAVVGDNSRDALWILSREPELDDAVLKRILYRLEVQGFDTERLKFTEQGQG